MSNVAPVKLPPRPRPVTPVSQHTTEDEDDDAIAKPILPKAIKVDISISYRLTWLRYLVLYESTPSLPGAKSLPEDRQ